MHFEVLGPVQVRSGRREVVRLSRRQRDILTVLLVERRRTVSRDRIIDAVWGAQPPPSAEASLQSHVSRLRSALRAARGGAGAEVLETVPDGYRLSAAPEEVDADVFESLVDAARTSGGDAVELYDRALSLWRGAAFDSYSTDELVRPEAVRLEELKWCAVEERIDALLGSGRTAEAIPSLEAVVSREPLRERPRAQLMTALYRSGRQTEALRVYHDYRSLLADELGLEPSPEIRRLEHDVLRHGGQVLVPGDARTARAAGGSLPPRSPTSFVGRDDDVRTITRLLRSTPLVTLVGPGGVGKTRLAEHVAHEAANEFSGGVVFCDLTPATCESAARVLASACGGSGRQTAAADDIIDSLSGRTTLVVLDNCEHVIDAAAMLVERIVRESPSATVLATSRERLAVAGEHVYPVPPLSLEPRGAQPPPAVQLLRDRAAAANAGRPDDIDADVAQAICEQLDGIPLAIELAASRVAVLHPADLARRLNERFELLTGGPRGTKRHRTLRNAVEWSYDLLSPQEACLFDRLGVFPAAFTIDAVQQICARVPISVRSVPGLLAQLAERSLVAVVPGAPPTRYRLLDTLRAFARERLMTSDELDEWRGVHLAWCVELVETAAEAILTADEGATVRLLDSELDNLRAAHEWACLTGRTPEALRLVVALERYAVQQLHDEVFSWAERSLRLPGARDQELFPCAAGLAAVGRGIRGDLTGCRQLAAAGVAAAGDGRDPRRLLPLMAMAEASLYEGRLDQFSALSEEELRLAESAGERARQVIATLHRVLVHAYRDEPDRALRLVERLHDLTRPLDGSGLACWALYGHGEALLRVDPRAAAPILQEAVECARRRGERFVEGVALVSLTSIHARSGEPSDALRALQRATRHWHERRDFTHQRVNLRLLVEVLARLGRTAPAALLLGATTGTALAPPSFGDDEARMASLVDALREALGDDRFSRAVARGRDMSRDEVVAVALEEIDLALRRQPGRSVGAGAACTAKSTNW